MAVRLSFLVAATVAALAIKQANSRPKPSENKEGKASKDGEKEERLEEQFADFLSFEDEEEEEDEDDEDKVRTVSSAISSAQSNLPAHGGVAGEEELLSEFEDLLSGEVALPLPRRRRPQRKDNAAEVEQLRRLVKEMEEREVMHEGELLEYYGLKEQEPDVAELRKKLKTTAAEVETLGATVSSLRAERERIEEAAVQGSEAAKGELEAARSAAAELKRQVAGLRTAAEAELEAARRAEAELERQVAEIRAAAAELEEEVAELRRKNRELENEKEEMAIKLDAAESRAVALSINWP